MKNIKIIALILIIATYATACVKSPNQIEPTNTVAIRVTPTIGKTSTPTAQPTTQPTVEPGKHTYANGIKSEEPIDLYYFDDSKDNSVLVLTESISIQFFPTTELKNIYISCPSMNDSYGTLTFEVFPWLSTYEATIEGTAVLTETFEDYADNALIKLSFDTPLPDGEYIILLTSPEPEKGVGIWTKPDKFDGQRVYADGMLLDDTSVQMQLSYANTPNSLYGTLSID
jgi:hypothetical protein